MLTDVTIKLEPAGSYQENGKVYAARETLIPGMTEAIIDLWVARCTNMDDRQENMIIERDPNFCEKHCVAIAPTLVDISSHA